MESKTCGGGRGGGGFVTMTLGGHRLCYLQTIRDIPPMPMSMPGQEGHGAITLNFYEFYSEPIWKGLIGNGDAYGGLRLQARYDNLRVRKIIKSPSGVIRARSYDIVLGKWEADWSVPWTEHKPTFMDGSPKQFTISYETTSIYPPPSEQ